MATPEKEVKSAKVNIIHSCTRCVFHLGREMQPRADLREKGRTENAFIACAAANLYFKSIPTDVKGVKEENETALSKKLISCFDQFR